jgi:hypothetical protein
LRTTSFLWPYLREIDPEPDPGPNPEQDTEEDPGQDQEYNTEPAACEVFRKECIPLTCYLILSCRHDDVIRLS